jgi:hypothetical protein
MVKTMSIMHQGFDHGISQWDDGLVDTCHVLLLLGQAGSFPLLREITFEGNSSVHHSFLLLLNAIKPTVNNISISTESGSCLEAAINRIVAVCPDLKTLCLRSEDAAYLNESRTVILVHSLAKLHDLCLENIAVDPSLLLGLDRHPSIRRLSVTRSHTRLEDNTHQSIDQPAVSLAQLEFLSITEERGRLKRLLSCFQDAQSLRILMLSCARESFDDTHSILRSFDGDWSKHSLDLFPQGFSAPALTELSVVLPPSHLHPSRPFFQAILKFDCLRTLTVSGTIIPSTPEDELLTVLPHLTALAELSYYASAEFYHSKSSTSFWSLGNIYRILEQCPRIITIAGSFDLNLIHIPKKIETVHPNLRRVDLGCSFFFLHGSEPRLWESAVVEYLTEVAELPLEIAVSRDKWPCRCRDVSDGPRYVDTSIHQRRASAEIISQCLKVANSVKKRLNTRLKGHA